VESRGTSEAGNAYTPGAHEFILTSERESQNKILKTKMGNKNT
jgi:hypothetical protein